MRLILLIILLPLFLAIAQDKNPNVELPDFVIMGQESISIKRAEKIKPDFVPTITDKFFKPDYPPENLGLRELSSSLKEDLRILDSTKIFNGNLLVEAGNNILPNALLGYTLPFKNGVLKTTVGGLNQLAYVDNAEKYSIRGGAGIEYTTEINNEVLGGTRFLLEGDYNSTSYKLFAVADTVPKRSLNQGNYSLGIKNTTGKTFIFDLQLDDYFTSIVEDKFTENLLKLNGFFKLQFSDIYFGVKSNYQKQFLNLNSSNKIDFDYYFIRPSFSFRLLNTIKAEIGYSFSKSGSKKFNNIYGSVGIRLSKNLVVLGEFSPQAEFVTSGLLLRKNEYLNTLNLTNLFLKKSNHFNAVVKYEFEQYYQVDAGLSYFKSINLPYYQDSDLAGRFDVHTADVNNYNVYLNLLFHPGPYGFMYGGVNYFHVRDNNSNKIPYQPYLTCNFSYGYEFIKGLLGVATIDFQSDRYVDIPNAKKLNAIFNLSLKLSYRLQETFILTLGINNLLNREVYLWNGYQEKPFDFTAGFNLLFD